MPNGERKFLGDVILAVDSAVRRMLEQNTDGRKGGMFRLFRVRVAEDGGSSIALVCTTLHGEPNPDKLVRYFDLTVEKAARLWGHLTDEHSSSWQSREPEEDRWGGAIIALSGYRLILSFSGLPELADEAVCLLAAVDVRLLTRSEAIAIATISDNKFFFTEWGSGLHQV